MIGKLTPFKQELICCCLEERECDANKKNHLHGALPQARRFGGDCAGINDVQRQKLRELYELQVELRSIHDSGLPLLMN